MIANAYEDRFGGIGRLFGARGLARLQEAHVCVIGVGGVGSWTVEALARSGIGSLTLVDLDDVCVTNINRQLPALDGEIGRPKVAVLADRIRLINPVCKVRAIEEFFTASNADQILNADFQYVIDAIDDPSNKSLLIAKCCASGIPVLTVGGAGGKRDFGHIQVTDLGESGNDALLRMVRKRLRREHGFPQKGPFGVPCIFSPEKVVFPWSDGSACEMREPGSSLALDCSSGFGTATFVTGVFGFAAAGEVVRRIASERAA